MPLLPCHSLLGRIGVWRHVVTFGSIGGIAVLAATGVIGRGNLPERFESKVVTIEPTAEDGVRIREVVDETEVPRTFASQARVRAALDSQLTSKIATDGHDDEPASVSEMPR